VIAKDPAGLRPRLRRSISIGGVFAGSSTTGGETLSFVHAPVPPGHRKIVSPGSAYDRQPAVACAGGRDRASLQCD